MRDTLARSPLFRGLPAGALDAVAAATTPFTMGPGTVLWDQGDPPRDLVVVQSGLVYEFQPGPRGRRSILQVVGPPHAVGAVAVFDRLPHVASAETVTETVVLAIHAEPVVALAAASTVLARNVVAAFTGYVHALAERRADLAALDLPRRTAKVLLRLAEPADQPSADPPTVAARVDAIAHLAGGKWRSVDAVIARLAKRGWLAVGPGGIRLLDVPALTRYAGGGVSGRSARSGPAAATARVRSPAGRPPG